MDGPQAPCIAPAWGCRSAARSRRAGWSGQWRRRGKKAIEAMPLAERSRSLRPRARQKLSREAKLMEGTWPWKARDGAGPGPATLCFQARYACSSFWEQSARADCTSHGPWQRSARGEFGRVQWPVSTAGRSVKRTSTRRSGAVLNLAVVAGFRFIWHDLRKGLILAQQVARCLAGGRDL